MKWSFVCKHTSPTTVQKISECMCGESLTTVYPLRLTFCLNIYFDTHTHTLALTRIDTSCCLFSSSRCQCETHRMIWYVFERFFLFIRVQNWRLGLKERERDAKKDIINVRRTDKQLTGLEGTLSIVQIKLYPSPICTTFFLSSLCSQQREREKQNVYKITTEYTTQ